MFDIGWSEMGLILMVALIVIGPKDLPRVARQVGRWSGKARAMAREFQRSIDDMAREAELHDIKQEIEKASRDVRSLDQHIGQHVDPDGDIRRALEPPRFDAGTTSSSPSSTSSTPASSSPTPAADAAPTTPALTPAAVDGEPPSVPASVTPAKPEPAHATAGTAVAAAAHDNPAADKS